MRHLKTSTLHIFEQDAFYTRMDQNLENIISEKGGTNILTLFPQQAATPNIQIYWVTIFEMEKVFPTA